MRIVSVNVGLPREIESPRGSVTTGIFKSPVSGRVRITTLQMAGDGQADLTVHGGVDQAVYVYSADHYAAWRADFASRPPAGGADLPWGAFGENIDVEGFSESSTCIGDVLRAGTATLQVTCPRLPCFKLGLKFADNHMIRRFLDSGRTGFYTRVLAEGDVAAGDELECVEADAARVPVSEVTRLYSRDRHDLAAMQRLLGVTALPESWRQHFEKRMADARS